MNQQHTPGRLRLFDTYADPEIRDDNEKLVAVVLAEKANSARRLVACWNACDGLRTESLERMGTLDRATIAHEVAAQSRIKLLEEQRDELLAALKLAEAALSDIGDADREPGDDVAWCEARAAKPLPEIRAAIAKAGGEA